MTSQSISLISKEQRGTCLKEFSAAYREMYHRDSPFTPGQLLFRNDAQLKKLLCLSEEELNKINKAVAVALSRIGKTG